MKPTLTEGCYKNLKLKVAHGLSLLFTETAKYTSAGPAMGNTCRRLKAKTHYNENSPFWHITNDFNELETHEDIMHCDIQYIALKQGNDDSL